MTEQEMKERSKIYTGDLFKGYDREYLERTGILGRTARRKMRHWCYKIHFCEVEGKELPADLPDGLKEFVESLQGFAGWKHFAHTWDIHGENPFMIVLRLMSVWREWEQVMDRVAIPLDAPPEQIHARIAYLEEDYARRHRKV